MATCQLSQKSIRQKVPKLKNEIAIKDAKIRDFQDRVAEANSRDKAGCGLVDTMRTKIEDQIGVTEGDENPGLIKSTHCEDDTDVKQIKVGEPSDGEALTAKTASDCRAGGDPVQRNADLKIT